jgi:hypothetical protein
MGAFGKHFSNGLHDIPPTAVIGRDSQRKPLIGGRERLAVAYELDDLRFESR